MNTSGAENSTMSFSRSTATNLNRKSAPLTRGTNSCPLATFGSLLGWSSGGGVGGRDRNGPHRINRWGGRGFRRLVGSVAEHPLGLWHAMQYIMERVGATGGR